MAFAWGVQAQEASQGAIEATYLVKLSPFVTWPGSAAPADPLVICVIGRDPFGPMLERVVAGERLGSRPLVVRRIATAAPGAGCDIAYLGGSPQQSVKQALTALGGAPVLTVTDQSATPGMVDFVTAGGHLRFRIDDAQAAAGGLSISSKLLSLAVSVKPRAPQGRRP